MSKEETLAKFKSHGMSTKDFDNAILIERKDLYVAMDEYGKQQAIAFNFWDEKSGYCYNSHKNMYFHKSQLVLNDDQTDYITPDQYYNLFIKHQKQQP